MPRSGLVHPPNSDNAALYPKVHLGLDPVI
jgi:hypothetical protein